MIKILFFDYRELERVNGFTRQLERPEKYSGNPLFYADSPWENGNMQLYGSVVKVPGKPFQLWYSVIHWPWKIYLAYAESKDGIIWRKPLFDIFKFNDEETNIIFTDNPHGPAVIYDPDDPQGIYKMVVGADPSECICAFRSDDGIHWRPVRRFPVIGTNPDCPMGFLRAPNGRYAIYHRLSGYGRRVFRSESHDFVYWSGEPLMVLEPDADDPTQVQFYGMGSSAYGPYEIGTLWIFHTDAGEYGLGKMRGYQEAELTYARSGYAWHRAAHGTAFIPHGGEGDWDCGNLQCASAPVYTEDEIRYYYMGTDMFHQTHWELEPQRAGLGIASIKPDRFVALRAGDELAELLTCAFRLPSAEIYVNASTDEGGWLKVQMLNANARVIEGLTEEDCIPIEGDSLSHQVRWNSQAEVPVDRAIRLRITGKKAAIYSIYVTDPGEKAVYYLFRKVN